MYFPKSAISFSFEITRIAKSFAASSLYFAGRLFCPNFLIAKISSFIFSLFFAEIPSSSMSLFPIMSSTRIGPCARFLNGESDALNSFIKVLFTKSFTESAFVKIHRSPKSPSLYSPMLMLEFTSIKSPVKSSWLL